MTDKQINFFYWFFILLEIFLLIANHKGSIELSLAILTSIVILLTTLFMNLWVEINEERKNNDR